MQFTVILLWAMVFITAYAQVCHISTLQLTKTR